MLRNKPRVAYNGLTIVMSNPSRFDKLQLCTANGGEVLNNYCLQPEWNKLMCDIRVMEDTSPFLPNTKCILLLGQAAMHFYCPTTRDNTLNEMRGSPLYVQGIPAIASYLPQDCADHKNHEQVHNPLAKDFIGGTEDDDNDYEDEAKDDIKETNENIKKFAKTKRRNFAFWLKMDIKKCKSLIRNNLYSFPLEPSPNYFLYPPSDIVIRLLSETKNSVIDFDIETDYEEQNLLCFAFTIDGISVYSVPVLNYNYAWSYPDLHRILWALSIAFRDNTIVAHNGATFDFFVMASKYGIAVKKPYDTLMAFHRCFPDVEKSLGHFTSLWTYQTFHKDSDSRAYFTREHMMQKLLYCGKDVFTMRLGRVAMESYSSTIPGLQDSIRLANRSILPYLTTTLQGILFDDKKRQDIIQENDRLMMQYLRCINLLIGEAGMVEVRSVVQKAKGGMPSSNPQCVQYFKEMLGYTVGRGKEKADGAKGYSLGKKNMYTLALKYDNPVIRFCLLYRVCKTETGYLKFKPWKDNDGKVMTDKMWEIQQTISL